MNIILFGDGELSENIYAQINSLKSFKAEKSSLDKLETNTFVYTESIAIIVLENMSFIKILTLNETLRNKEISAIFVSTFRSRVLLGPTYFPKESAGIDSALYFSFQEKLGKLSEEQAKNLSIPSFSKISKNKDIDSFMLRLMSKLLLEVKHFNNNKISRGQLKYVDKVELLSLNRDISKEKYIYPAFELNSLKRKLKEKSILNYKKEYAKFLNTKETIKGFEYYESYDNNNNYKSIGIVGGGSAGYLTAIALKKKFPSLNITLIESSKIPVIGVGEATIPSIQTFLFETLGLNKLDFYKEVEPTWKLGIKFEWGLPNDYYFNYPFGRTNIFPAYLNGDINKNSLNSILMSRDASFVLKVDDASNTYQSLSSKMSYAYHLDNKKFINFLKNHAKKIGVEYIDATIKSAKLKNEKIGIDYLITENNENLKFDFYVDCTGFRSILMEKTLQSQFVDYSSSLPTNKAIIGHCPHNGFIKPYTLAKTMNHGWCWNTPVRECDHRGYVFSSKFCTDEEAEREMRNKVPNLKETKIIHFRTGRLTDFIKGNVVAIGNSYAFVEPLESTGIHMITKEIKSLLNNLNLLSRDFSGKLRKSINEDMNNQWDYLRYFLAIHYKFNHKIESEFWKFCHKEVNVTGIEEILDIYKNVGPLSMLNKNLKKIASSKIYDHIFGLGGIDNILLGQGILPYGLKNAKLINNDLWQLNVNNWNNLADISVPLNEDINILTRRPELI